MVKTVYLAKPRGFCAGVVMAIEAVEKAAERMRGGGQGDLAVYHAIVHNDTVVRRLEEGHGVHFVEDLDEMKVLEERARAEGGSLADTVVFSAHGVSPAVRERADALRLHTIDATCPLVTKVHSEAKKYARLGYHILLIGDSTHHQEVVGTYGEAPESTTVVSVVGNRKHDPELASPDTVKVPDPDKVVVLTQTTLSVDDTAKTVEILRRRFPRLVVPSRDDLCYATKNRQDAVKEIAPHVDLFLVVTSDYSSNGMRLLELADELTGNAKRIEGVADIDDAWLEGVHSVGITSAASTPDDLVQEMLVYFRERNADLEVVEEGEWEDITFREPKRVAPSSI
ncbi:MAG: 4-hydroxy-3-methylbut-2-enyl diphosphate reductase [Acidobacteria bacterium]|nr:4-hydroxy-3-methylbut-2-enyl diphosphate reductase [Acidobacteriota bacterium]NIM61871.1 4-hydroxy-3-methylbut-2-enyl diphosphate reductase [Acidobacteriota bacterium]NIO60828.1 4-hydroxy-3-methylbut-2-enyl diphosphate reductase [Acidobacteriota bacterium]NIQ31903.1 4-hydroxy-3-methylbut-2-enyl diphosphate reductase [Acidobacteriota bacterium]NIQ87280.1 4-hydroxy-3-methylbut-2-enyl diphosphate reductase [Acidobacteriota bacterium]